MMKKTSNHYTFQEKLNPQFMFFNMYEKKNEKDSKNNENQKKIAFLMHTIFAHRPNSMLVISLVVVSQQRAKHNIINKNLK